MPIESKESIPWLDNLRLSVDLLGEPGRLVHVAGREGNLYELFCLARDPGRAAGMSASATSVTTSSVITVKPAR